MPKYLVETISMFRLRYVVEAKCAEHATDEVVMNISEGKLREFSQKHLDEIITSSREIDREQYLQIFNEDNDYLQDWDEDQKLQFVNEVDYGTK